MNRSRTLVRLAVESLDPRLAPAVFTWTAGGTTNNFSDADNWQGLAVPDLDGTAELMFPATAQLKTGTAGLLAINDLAGADGTTTFKSIVFMDSYQVEDVNGADISSLTTEVTQSVTVMAGTVKLDTQLMLPGGSNLSVNGNSIAVASLKGTGTVDVGTGTVAIADLNGANFDLATEFDGEIGGAGTFSIAHNGSAALGGLLSLGGPTARVEVEAAPSIFFNGTIAPAADQVLPTFDVSSGFLAFSGASLPSNFVPGTSSEKAIWDFSNNATNTVTLAGLTGKGITISGNSDVILDGKAKQKNSIGKVSGLGSLTMSGQGTQTIDSIQLTAQSGQAVRIASGILVLNGPVLDGGGFAPETILEQGVLGGNVSGDVGLRVTAFGGASGVIDPGDPGAIGSLQFDALTISNAANVTFQFQVAGATAGTFDRIVLSDAGDLNGNLVVDVLPGAALSEQQKITIVDTVTKTGSANTPFLNLSDNDEFVDASGRYRFRINYGQNGASDVVLTVVGTPPTITDIVDRQVPFNSPNATIPFTVGDAQTAAAGLNVSAQSSNATLIPLSSIQLAGSGADRTVTIMPVAGQSGLATITIVVVDESGASTTDTFEYQVLPPSPPPPPPNAPPVAVDDAATTPFQTSVLISVLANDTDADGNTLGIVSTSVPVNGVTNIVGTKVRYTPKVGFSGSDSFTYTIGDGKGGSDSATVSITVGDPPPVGGPQLIGFRQFTVGTDAGGERTSLFGPDGSLQLGFDPFPGFTGGVRTAAADFDGDGIADFVSGTGPGRPTQVLVQTGKGAGLLFMVDPFEPSFTGGVYVASGDVDGDGIPDLAITPDEGGGPRVDIYSGGKGFQRIASFFGIDDANFRGGARAAIADITGDGTGDLIIVAGFGGGPRVAGFDGTTLVTGPRKIFGDFFAFEQTLRNGVFVTAGDLNGDGFADLIAGGGPGGGPRVLAFDGKSLLSNQYVTLANFFGGDPNSRGGIRLAVKNLDGDSKADLVVGAGTGAGSRVTAYLGKNIAPAGTPPAELDFEAVPNFTGGVFVG